MASLFDGRPAREASAMTGFAGNTIDRRSEERPPDALATALSDPAARLYLFGGERALVKPDGDPMFSAAEAGELGVRRADTVLLGWTPAGPRLTATRPNDAPLPGTIVLVELRALAATGGVSAEHLGALAQARSLTNWHARHRFCANCGAATTVAHGGYRRDCATCGAQHFPRTDPVVIMLAIDTANGGDNCLLGRQPRFMPDVYSCLAGFMEPGETIEDAVRRETFEEAGVSVGRVAYHACQPWPFPSSLMIGCHAEALTTEIVLDQVELEDARWFSRGEARAILAGTHRRGIRAPAPFAIANSLLRAWAEG